MGGEWERDGIEVALSPHPKYLHSGARREAALPYQVCFSLTRDGIHTGRELFGYLDRDNVYGMDMRIKHNTTEGSVD